MNDTVRVETREKIRKALANGPLPIRDICTVADEPKWRVYSELQKMLVNKEIGARKKGRVQRFRLLEVAAIGQ